MKEGIHPAYKQVLLNVLAVKICYYVHQGQFKG
jgi:ribosomal protein L31